MSTVPEVKVSFIFCVLVDWQAAELFQGLERHVALPDEPSVQKMRNFIEKYLVLLSFKTP